MAVIKNVLDDGYVELVDHMGSDLTVVNAARVSFMKKAEELDHKDKLLIDYLADHNHWTPFAHAMITLSIKAPISIRTQFFKHKIGFTENEVSRRYVKYRPDWYHPDWRAAPEKSMKQGSSGPLDYDKESDAMNIDGDYHFAMAGCVSTYERLIQEGVAPEQARFVLPQGCYTQWYWTGSLAAYARFYSLRIESTAQWEIQQYAEVIGDIVRTLFPFSWEALVREKPHESVEESKA